MDDSGSLPVCRGGGKINMRGSLMGIRKMGLSVLSATLKTTPVLRLLGDRLTTTPYMASHSCTAIIFPIWCGYGFRQMIWPGRISGKQIGQSNCRPVYTWVDNPTSAKANLPSWNSFPCLFDIIRLRLRGPVHHEDPFTKIGFQTKTGFNFFTE